MVTGFRRKRTRNRLPCGTKSRYNPRFDNERNQTGLFLMSINPYQAPSSELTAPVQTNPARPLAINLACWLFGLSSLAGCAIFIPGAGMDWKMDSPRMVYGMITGTILDIAVTIWLIHAISKGKNWARWAVLVLSVLAVCMLFIPGENPPLSKLIHIITIISTLAYLPGCALLFFGRGGRWFAQIKNAD